MPAPFYTAAMVRALPDDGRRYETVFGELLVSPAPRVVHQRVVSRLAVALGTYLKRERVGELFTSPSDISWRPDVLVQPDLFVAPLEETRTNEWGQIQTLLLAVEVLCPSSVRADRVLKRKLYQSVGVRVYWVVDPDHGQVEVWTPGIHFPATERTRLVWQPEGAPQPFCVGVEELVGVP